MCKIQIPEGATLDERRSICFDALYKMNLNDKVEKKDNLTYLTWSEAWKAFKEVYPSATYRIISNPDTKLPYFADDIGVMVFTEVTADDLTLPMFLPVLNSANKPMKLQSYTYKVWDKQNNRYVERTCEAVTMFDVNRALMRCLVKNLAMFGLGLYIYQGEDMPTEEQAGVEIKPATQPQQKASASQHQSAEAQPQSASQSQTQVSAEQIEALKSRISSATEVSALVSIYMDNTALIEGNAEIKNLITNRKKALTALNS